METAPSPLAPGLSLPCCLAAGVTEYPESPTSGRGQCEHLRCKTWGLLPSPSSFRPGGSPVLAHAASENFWS